MNFKISRRMDASKIRSICISHQLYTLGNNADYSDMFDKATMDTQSAQDFEQLVYETAVDILNHSDTDMPIESIMWYLFNEATTTYVE